MNGQDIRQYQNHMDLSKKELNDLPTKGKKKSKKKDQFDFFLEEHASAPISSRPPQTTTGPLTAFVYKWDFIEKRFKCMKEAELLKSGRVDRQELVGFLQQVHSLPKLNPKPRSSKSLAFISILLLVLLTFALLVFTFAPNGTKLVDSSTKTTKSTSPTSSPVSNN